MSMLDVPQSSFDAPSDGTITVEAPTAEAALREVADRLGPRAQIIDVAKVPRGGVGGFFAREMVQVSARLPGDTAPAPAPVPASEPADPGEAMGSAPGSFRSALIAELRREEPPTPEGRPELPPAPPPSRTAEPARVAEAEVEDALFDSHPQERSGGDAAESEDASPSRRIAAGDTTVDIRPRELPAIAGEQRAATADSAPERPMPVERQREISHALPAPAEPTHPAPPPLAEAISERLQRELPTRRERASADHSLPARGRERPTIAPPIEARLGEDRTMHSTTPITADPDAPAGAGVVTWSVANLQRAGLPASIVDACWELNTDDEFIWMRAITRAVSVFCRPLPRGAAVIAGPRALRLANGLRIPTAKVGGLPPYGGTVGLRVKDDEKSRAWFREVRGERWLHLVVGGRRWQGLLHDEPLAVSWVGHDALPEALSLCARFGLVLGYGISDEREAPAVRATPTDVAVAIRSLMPRG